MRERRGEGGGVRRVEGQCLPQDAKEKTEAGTEVQDSETTNSRQGPRFGPTLARKLPDRDGRTRPTRRSLSPSCTTSLLRPPHALFKSLLYWASGLESLVGNEYHLNSPLITVSRDLVLQVAMGWQITDAQAAGALCMRDLLHLRCTSGLVTT